MDMFHSKLVTFGLTNTLTWINKHPSLLLYHNNYNCKKFQSIGPRTVINKLDPWATQPQAGSSVCDVSAVASLYKFAIKTVSRFTSFISFVTRVTRRLEKKIAKFFKKLPNQKRPKHLQQSSIWKPKTSTTNHFWNLKIPTTNHALKLLINLKI